jgi:hypothetical protein
MKASEHQWTDGDNLVAYHLYRLGANSLHFSKSELAEAMGMSSDSLDFKIANFKALDGKGGLYGYSPQAERIYKQYSPVADTDLIMAAMHAVVRAMEVRMTTLQVELARRRQ